MNINDSLLDTFLFIMVLTRPAIILSNVNYIVVRFGLLEVIEAYVNIWVVALVRFTLSSGVCLLSPPFNTWQLES